MQKIITEILATNDSESSISFARDARDLLIDCCVEFITLISSEANEIAEREAKKTIATEHIDKALKELGFPEYVGEVLASAGEMKESLKVSSYTPAFGKREPIIPRSEDCGTLIYKSLKKRLTMCAKQTREKKTSKMDQSGLTQEELLQQQQELFASATSKFNQGP